MEKKLRTVKLYNTHLCIWICLKCNHKNMFNRKHFHANVHKDKIVTCEECLGDFEIKEVDD